MKQSRLIRRYIDYEGSIEQHIFLDLISMYIFANSAIRLYREQDDTINNIYRIL